MSEGGSTPFTPAGALTVDFVALLLLGRERGYLTPDDLISVMESVELTPALIAAAIGRVEAEGIEWRDDTDLGSDSRPRGGAERRSGDFEEEPDEELGLSRCRPDRSSPARRTVAVDELERETIEEGDAVRGAGSPGRGRHHPQPGSGVGPGLPGRSRSVDGGQLGSRPDVPEGDRKGQVADRRRGSGAGPVRRRRDCDATARLIECEEESALMVDRDRVEPRRAAPAGRVWPPSGSWSSRTCAWWSPSPSATATGAWPFWI